MMVLTACLSMTVLPILGIASARGVDAGWGWFGMIILAPLCAGCLFGLTIGILCRPKDAGWRLGSILPSVGVTLGLFGVWYWSNAAELELKLTDSEGAPLAHVKIENNREERYTDAKGRVTIRARRGQPLELLIAPITGDLHAPGSCQLTLRPERDLPGQMEVAQSWERQFGSELLSEHFTRRIPAGRRMRIGLVVPSRGPLPSVVLRENVSQAIGTRAGNYPTICGNLEAIEMAPRLIKISRFDPDPYNMTMGLTAIAEMLEEMHRGCSQLERELAPTGRSGAGIVPSATQLERIEGVRLWAGIPAEDASDPLRLLAMVRTKIRELAMPLIEFSLEAKLEGRMNGDFLHEIREIARPTIPSRVAWLLENPPRDHKTAERWANVFDDLGATKEELRDLLKSTNPLLKSTARFASGQ